MDDDLFPGNCPSCLYSMEVTEHGPVCARCEADAASVMQLLGMLEQGRPTDPLL